MEEYIEECRCMCGVLTIPALVFGVVLFFREDLNPSLILLGIAVVCLVVSMISDVFLKREAWLDWFKSIRQQETQTTEVEEV
jgi:hypothetical protein